MLAKLILINLALMTSIPSFAKGGMGLGKKNCFVVNKTRERLCDSRAEKFCKEHKNAKECKRFINSDVSKP
jgi:hypothetical protein